METNLFDYHAKITEYLSANNRPAKIETYIEKSSVCLQKIIEKNDELKSLSMHSKNAAETINQFEFFLGSTTAKHDDVLVLAKSYLQIKHQEDQVVTPSESVRSKKPISQRSKIASITSSERRREAALAKIRREEVERQVEAKLRLKKQEIQIQSMKGQLDLDVVVEESRQKLAEATIEEAEYLEDASEICELRRSRSKLAMAVQENQTEEDRTRSCVNTQFPTQEIVQPVAPVQSVNLEPAFEFLSYSSIEPPFSRNLTKINNSHPFADYFETTCINSQIVNVPHTSNTSVSLPNPKLNSTYEPQEQLPLTNLFNYNPLMQSSFHHSNIPTSSMPIAQQTFLPSNSANFVYQPLLPTNVGPLNPPTVTFSPNSFYVTQPSNVQPFSSGGTTFYVGDPKT